MSVPDDRSVIDFDCSTCKALLVSSALSPDLRAPRSATGSEARSCPFGHPDTPAPSRSPSAVIGRGEGVACRTTPSLRIRGSYFAALSALRT